MLSYPLSSAVGQVSAYMTLYGGHIPQIDYLWRMSRNVASPRSYGPGAPAGVSPLSGIICLSRMPSH
jgi:hypothetical protein